MDMSAIPPTDEQTQLSPKDLNTDETKSSEPSSPRRTPAPYYHVIPSSFHIFDGEEDFGDWLNLLDFYLEEVPDNEKSRALLKHLARQSTEKFLDRRQQPHESPRQFAEDMLRLCKEAYRSLNAADAEEVTLHHFIKGLSSRTLAESLQLQPPAFLEDAIDRADRFVEVERSKVSPGQNWRPAPPRPQMANASNFTPQRFGHNFNNGARFRPPHPRVPVYHVYEGEIELAGLPEDEDYLEVSERGLINAKSTVYQPEATEAPWATSVGDGYKEASVAYEDVVTADGSEALGIKPTETWVEDPITLSTNDYVANCFLLGGVPLVLVTVFAFLIACLRGRERQAPSTDTFVYFPVDPSIPDVRMYEEALQMPAFSQSTTQACLIIRLPILSSWASDEKSKFTAFTQHPASNSDPPASGTTFQILKYVGGLAAVFDPDDELEYGAEHRLVIPLYEDEIEGRDEKDTEGKPPLLVKLDTSPTDESETCPICLETWTTSGTHRICCLRCGHLFGKSCILKWLATQGRVGKCPQCNAEAQSKDIRVLFCKKNQSRGHNRPRSGPY
nr:unnamed protein product [Spirometra erinaceieuropaei]